MRLWGRKLSVVWLGLSFDFGVGGESGAFSPEASVVLEDVVAI